MMINILSNEKYYFLFYSQQEMFWQEISSN